MNVLLDECVDPKARAFFSEEFKVAHVKDLGWLGIKNGDLVQRADAMFEVLITIDGNMRYQTSLKGLSLTVVVGSGRFRSLQNFGELVRRFEIAAPNLSKGRYHTLGLGE